MIDLSLLSPATGEDRYRANDLIKAMGPWSVSRAKLAARCAQQYEWQYLDKREGDADIEARDDSMRIGSAMHEIYEELLKGETDLNAAYEKAIHRHLISTNERETMSELFAGVEWFMAQVHSFIQTRVFPGRGYILAELVRDGYMGVEKKFSLDGELKYTKDYFNNQGATLLRGVIDLILFTQDGGAIVIDHKSARFPNMTAFADQLRAYTVAIMSLYPQIRWVQCGVHFMPLQEVKWTQPVLREDIEGEQRALYYFLTNAANNVLTREIQIGNHCKWCPFRTSCKALRKERRKAARLAAKAAQAAA